MQPNPEAGETRRAAAAEDPSPLDLAAARYRALLRARIEICAALRRQRASSAIGGTLAAALRLGEDAAAELALIPDTAELRRRDELLLAGDAAPDGSETQIRLLVEEYRTGRALDLFTASPIELLACCVARAG
jgi:hypothetical protein